MVGKHTIPIFPQKFVQSVVQNMDEGHVRCLAKRITAAKDLTIFQKCAVQRNNQPTMWRMGQKLLKLLKKVSRIILFFTCKPNYFKDGTT